MDFDTLNQQLAGSPLWEQVKADALAKFKTALGLAAAPVLSRRPDIPAGTGTVTLTSRNSIGSKALALRDRGLSYKQIATRLRTTVGTVGVELCLERKRRGVKAEPHGRKPDPTSQRQRAFALIRAGKSNDEAGAVLGIHRTAVASYRSQLRAKGEAV